MKYQYPDFTYDESAAVIANEHGQHKLTKLQNNVFKYLVDRPQEIIDKNQLMEDVWGRVITGNSVDQIISTLRKYTEPDLKKHRYIVTHHGKGISFEGVKEQSEPQTIKAASNNKLKPIWVLGLLAVCLLIGWQWLAPEKKIPQQTIKQNQRLLIMPMTFSDITASDAEKSGLYSSLKSAFERLDSEGRVVFDDSDANFQQVMEKHWRIENDLNVLQSRIIKNGDLYEAVLEISNGLEVVAQTTLSADSLARLMDDQVAFVNSLHSGLEANVAPLHMANQYILAQGHKKLGHLDEALELANQSLNLNSDDHPARLLLAELLVQKKAYDQALAQLKTLKSTVAYERMGAEIELLIGQINLAQKNYQAVITELANYQLNHAEISDIKKAKMKLLLAEANQFLGNNQQALMNYKQAVSEISGHFYPEIFARSLYGQSLIQMGDSLDSDVIETLQQALDWAKQANDLKQQSIILDRMSQIKYMNNEWAEGIKLLKQSITLMELTGDKSEVALGLGTLTAYLIQRGYFSEVKEVIQRLKKIAIDAELNNLQLIALHYESVVAMNEFDFTRAADLIEEHLQLAQESNNRAMELNNTFLHLEWLLSTKNIESFKTIWDQRVNMIKDLGFERFMVYMDLYLARYYKQSEQFELAKQTIDSVSERALATKDIKFYVDAQNQLAEIVMQTDPQRALEILEAIAVHEPNPNPYLELKAIALNMVGKKVEALQVLNQAKLLFNEAWKAENQALLEHLEAEL